MVKPVNLESFWYEEREIYKDCTLVVMRPESLADLKSNVEFNVDILDHVIADLRTLRRRVHAKIRRDECG